MFTVMIMDKNISRHPVKENMATYLASHSLVTTTARVMAVVMAVAMTAGAGLLMSGCGSETELPSPVIAAVTPDFRTEDVRTPVVITGVDFLPLIQVGPQGESQIDARFKLNLEKSAGALGGQGGVSGGGGGSAEALVLYDVRYVNKTRLEAVIPNDLGPGKYDLVMESPLGSTVRLSEAFECRLPPVITAVEPLSGPRQGGTAISVSGNNFIEGTVVHVDGKPIDAQSIKNLTQISGFLPPGDAEGEVDVCVTSPYGQELVPAQCLTGGFTYTQGLGELEIEAVVPDFGPAAGGNQVVLHVLNLTGSTRIYVGENRIQAGLRFNTDEGTVAFSMPAGVPGSVSITVERDDSSFTMDDAYSYEGTPVVNQINPSAGRAAGGELITVSGEWLLEGTVVELDNRPLTDVEYAADGSTITGYTPRGRGSVTVKVYGRGKVSENVGVNGRLVIANGFAYRGSPRLSSISPSLGPQEPVDTGYQLTLTGEGFVQGMDVMIGGAKARAVVVTDNGTKATCLLPPGKGIVSVTIATPDGVATLVDAFTYRPPLVVTKIVPRLGWGGEEMVITGDGLSRCNKVLIGSNELGSLEHDGDAVLIGEVPPANQGPASIRVECGQDGIIVVEGAFTYREPRDAFAPERVVPLAGPVAGGNTMWVYGNGGKGLGTDVVVTVGGQPLENVQFFGESSLKGQVPAGAAAGTAQVVISRWSERQVWSQPYVYTEGESDLFDVFAIEPATGSMRGGNLVRITGSGFSQGMVVTIGGRALQGLVVRNVREAYGYVPGGDAEGVVPVLAYNGSKVCSSCTQAQPGGININYTYLNNNSFAIASIYPTTGPEQGGTVFTIQGTGLGLGSIKTVRFGNQNATAVSLVEMGAEGLTPVRGNNPQTVDVTVELHGGATATLPGAFTYHGDTVLTLSEITPQTGVAGASVNVALRGSAFTRSNTTATIGGLPVTNMNVSIPTGRLQGTQATAKVPVTLAAGIHDVIVRDGAREAVLQKAYCAKGATAPQVSSMNPNTGPAQGGIMVQIFGSSFQADTVAMLGGRPLINMVVSADGTLITGNIPPGSGTAQLTLSAGCEVWDGGKTFTYTGGDGIPSDGPPVPAVIQPARGPATGGTLVVISGRNMGQVFGAQLGGVNLNNFVVLDENTVAGITPSGLAGSAVKLDLMNNGGIGSLNQAFTYLNASSISGVTPATGYSRGGDSVRINCTNLTKGATATIGGVPLAEVVVNTASGYITGKTPPGLGVARVEVKSANGTAVLENGFTYMAAPVILSVTPASGPRTGGTPVTVKGLNFPTGDIAIRFGPSLIQSRQRVDSETITGKTPPGWGPVDVTAETFSGVGGLVEAFTYMEPPLITRVVPALGRQEGNTLVVIEGINFSEDVSFEVAGRSMLQPEPGASYYLGAGLGAGRTPSSSTIGPVGVTATEAWGSSTKSNGFRYVQKWTQFDMEEVADGPFTAVTSCMDGHVWVATDQGLLRISSNDDADMVFHSMKEFGGERINSLNCFRPGVLAVGSNMGMGICSVHEGSTIRCRVVDDLDIAGAPSPLVVRSVNEFAAGRIAGATTGGMLVVLARGGLGASAAFMVDSRSSLPANDIRDLAVNDAYTALLATPNGAALYDFRNGSVSPFDMAGSSIPSDDVRSVVVGDGGVFYVGLDNGMAYALPPAGAGVPRIWVSIGGLPGGPVGVLAADQDGNIWAALESEGVVRIVDGAVVEQLDQSDGLPAGTINSIHVDYNGAVYFVSDSGVSRLAP